MMHHDYGLGPVLLLPQGSYLPSNWPFTAVLVYSGARPTYVPPSEDSIIAYACSNLNTPVVWC